MVKDQVLEKMKDQITEEEYKELLSDLNEVTTRLGITPQD